MSLHLTENTTYDIASWTNNMVHVSTVDVLVDKVKGGQKWITITGNAGDGKTTLGYLVLKAFVETMNVYVVETPEDYSHISKIREERIVMLNDIFGAFTFDQFSLNLWRNIVRGILDSHEKETNPMTRVILVSRKNVLQEAKDHLEHYGAKISAPICCLDLSTVKNQDERFQILDYHLKRKNIVVPPEVKSKVAVLKTSHGFPHCCKMFADLCVDGHNVDIVKFFLNPLIFLDATTRLLFKTNCEELFVSMLKNDGEFNVNSVQDDKERRFLRNAARGQEGSYLIKNGQGVWVFSHPSVYESVMSVLAENDPLLLVTCLKDSVLLQKLRFMGTAGQATTCFIQLEPETDLINKLVEKFLPRIREGQYHIFLSGLTNNREFCDKLITMCFNCENSSINKPDRLGITAMHYAAKASNSTAVRCLVEQGADLDKGDLISQTALIIICTKSPLDLDLLEFMVDKSPESILHSDALKMTALHYLCHNADISVSSLQILISRGAQINKQDSKGRTPLHFLCQQERASLETIQFMIGHGADVNRADRYGSTPLHKVCAHRGSHIETKLALMINKGADVNARNNIGMTPLHYQCQGGDVTQSCIELFVKKEASVNFGDKDCMTPLHYLCRHIGANFEPILNLLVKYGADVNQRDRYGESTLSHLCRHYSNGERKWNAMRALISVGGNVNAPDDDGMSPLHWLCARVDENSSPHDGIQILLQQGAVLTANRMGHTQLDYLLKRHPSDSQAIQLLMAAEIKE